MLWSQQHAALDFFWQLVSPLPTTDRVWCWGAMTQMCLSMLGHLSVPDARLIQHESTWVPTFFWNFSFFKNVHHTSHFPIICSLWRMQFNKSITEDKFNLIVLLFFPHFFVHVPIICYLSGHHPGIVDPLCCVCSIWGWIVCLVLHRWIGPQRAGTLWEQLHQRAGVCVFCVGEGECLIGGTVMCVYLNLSDSTINTYSNSNALTTFQNLVLGRYTLKIKRVCKVFHPNTNLIHTFSPVGGRSWGLCPQPTPY